MGGRAAAILLAILLLAAEPAGLSADTETDRELEGLLSWLEIRLGRELDIVDLLSLRVFRDEGVALYELEVYKAGRLVVLFRPREGTYALVDD